MQKFIKYYTRFFGFGVLSTPLFYYVAFELRNFWFFAFYLVCGAAFFLTYPLVIILFLNQNKKPKALLSAYRYWAWFGRLPFVQPYFFGITALGIEWGPQGYRYLRWIKQTD